MVRDAFLALRLGRKVSQKRDLEVKWLRDLTRRGTCLFAGVHLNMLSQILIADIYISISTGTFDIENIKYEKKWQQLDLDTNFEP